MARKAFTASAEERERDGWVGRYSDWSTNLKQIKSWSERSHQTALPSCSYRPSLVCPSALSD